MNFNVLLNNEDQPPPKQSQQQPPTTPATIKPPVTVPSSSSRFSITSIVNNDADSRKPSISSLTNDNDIDIKGNQTPNITHRILNNKSPNAILQSPIVRKTSSIASLLSDDQPINRNISTSSSPKISHSPPKFINESPSSKITITDELKQLEKLEKQIKPKKYEIKPIWAQDWIPLVKRNMNMNMNMNIDIGENKVEISRTKQTYNPNLEVSFTKVIPYEDLTRKVSQWLYSHLNNLREQSLSEGKPENDLLKYVEFEMKFGRIWSKELDARIDLPISSETIFTDQINYTFKPGVENNMFIKLEDFLMKLNAKNNQEIFKNLKSDTVDFFYHGIRRGDKPYDLRLSKDKETNRTINQIEKKRVGDLYIYNPSNILDFKLSLSLELPINDIPKSILKNDANMKRRKIRTSYINPGCKNQVDMTKTYTFHNNNNNNKPEQNMEVEIEIDNDWLLKSFLNLFHTTDNSTYEDTIKVLLDNSRILNRSLG